MSLLNVPSVRFPVTTSSPTCSLSRPQRPRPRWVEVDKTPVPPITGVERLANPTANTACFAKAPERTLPLQRAAQLRVGFR